MRKTLMLLVASTALTAAIGVPAWSAMQAPATAETRPFASAFEDRGAALPFLLVADDDDDDDDDDDRRTGDRRGHDDDDDCDDDDEDDDDDDDDDDCGVGMRNPAPAGTVAPPQNGLFGNGAAPQVQVN